MATPEEKALRKEREVALKAEKRRVREIFNNYNYQTLIDDIERKDRKFVIHSGPTNSGKTYSALQSLRKAKNGIYLGPLRLLALEVFDTLNLDGVPCSLLTGEEQIEIPFSAVTASTIEMCDYTKHYDIAVIDEAQLMGDSFRGHHWTRAVLNINADLIHICCSPSVVSLLERIMTDAQMEYTIETTERLTPLEVSSTPIPLSEVEEGDAIIAFSRKNVLAIAAHFDAIGKKASVIYGALPPEARREEIRKFVEHETSVVVATDAIGMGVSLPIKRVIFSEIYKFNGQSVRKLSVPEVLQIAGRAGRYGRFEKGYVAALERRDHIFISDKMRNQEREIKSFVIPFPAHILDETTLTVKEVLQLWNESRRLPDPVLIKSKVDDEIFLCTALYNQKIQIADKHSIFKYVSCPVDVKKNPLVMYWASCVRAIEAGDKIPEPEYSLATLEDCELAFRKFDIANRMAQLDGITDRRKIIVKKQIINNQINKFLKQSKSKYGKKCSSCGKRLPPTYRYNICDRCYRERTYFSESW